MALLLMSVSLVTAADDPRRPPAIAAEHVPVVPDELAEQLRQYQNVREAGFRGWSPDGKGILIATRFGNTTQLHRVLESGSRRTQLTFLDEPVDGRFVPETKNGTLILTTSRGGNENFQIARLDRGFGRPIYFTDGKSRNILDAISPDGKRLVFTSNRRNGRDMDLVLANIDEGESDILMQVKNESWSVSDWSLDGKTLLLNHYVSINESHPALFHIGDRDRTMIPIPEDAVGAFGPMKFDFDGRSFYVASDIAGEFRRLARVERRTFEFHWLTKDIPWDVESIEVDPKTGQVAFSVNEDGASGLYLLKDDKPLKVEIPLGVLGSLEFSPDSRQLGFTLARPDAPADVYSLDLESKALTRWTYSEVGGLDPEQFVAPKLVRFKSFDGLTVPAWVSLPRGASKEQPAPVLINIHGGPESQTRPTFSGLDQFYLNEMGVAVIKPNVRGSAGFGKTYLKLDNGPKREDSVRDIGALLDWIATQPELDASRVAVYGGSYGGYMVLASLVHYSDRLKAGVDVVGIASFESFLKNTSAYRVDLRRAEYGDERDPAMLEVFRRIDPLHRAEKITAALMVAHGRNDPRVPFSEAQQIVTKVRSEGRTVWTVYADNEGHGFAKKDNRDYVTAATALFLRQTLTLSGNE
jgi:dipeptidyl aminopeptidase/acylaminoacyl peptidase